MRYAYNISYEVKYEYVTHTETIYDKINMVHLLFGYFGQHAVKTMVMERVRVVIIHR